jgi:hypothetical protein
MPTPHAFGTLREILAELRRELPTALPLEVRRVKIEDAAGDCGIVGGKFRIRIARDLAPDVATLIACHEYAHALSWHESEMRRADDHDAEWGVAYSRVWRVVTNHLTRGKRS